MRLIWLLCAIQFQELSAFTTWRHCELSVAAVRLIWLLCAIQSQLFSAFTSVAALRVVFGCGAPYLATVRRPVSVQYEKLSAFTAWRHGELCLDTVRRIWLPCAIQSQHLSAFTSVAAL